MLPTSKIAAHGRAHHPIRVLPSHDTKWAEKPQHFSAPLVATTTSDHFINQNNGRKLLKTIKQHVFPNKRQNRVGNRYVNNASKSSCPCFAFMIPIIMTLIFGILVLIAYAVANAYMTRNALKTTRGTTVNVSYSSVSNVSTTTTDTSITAQININATITETTTASITTSLLATRSMSTSTTATSTSTTTTSSTLTTTTTTTTSTSTNTTSTTTTSTSTNTTSTTTTSTSTTTTSSTLTTTTTAIPAVARSSQASYCGCSSFTLSLANITFTTSGATYEWQLSPNGLNTWSNITSFSSVSSLTISNQTSSTDYRCLISVVTPTAAILISTVVTVKNAYCAPSVVNCAAGDEIYDFILMGELNTSIYNTATGCALNSYDNETVQSVTLSANKTYVVLVSSQYASSDYVKIWIDFNDNCIFESSESVGSRILNSTLDTPVAVNIPAIGMGARNGSHRMRVTVAYNSVPDPCSSSNTYGETHDYTVNVLGYIMNNINSTSITVTTTTATASTSTTLTSTTSISTTTSTTSTTRTTSTTTTTTTTTTSSTTITTTTTTTTRSTTTTSTSTTTTTSTTTKITTSTTTTTITTTATTSSTSTTTTTTKTTTSTTTTTSTASQTTTITTTTNVGTATTTTTTAPFCLTYITFDDLTGASSTPVAIPNGYNNLNWTNAEYVNASVMPVSGYQTAVYYSGSIVVDNTGSNFLSLSSINGLTFSFDFVAVASAWREALNWTLTGYRGASVSVSGTFFLSTYNRTDISCSTCTGLTRLTMSSSGGVPRAGLAKNGTQFVMDDLCISFGY